MVSVARMKDEHTPGAPRSPLLATYEMTLLPRADDESVVGGAPAAVSRVSVLDWCAEARTITALVDGARVAATAVLSASDADAPAAALGTNVQLFGADGSVAQLVVADVAQQAAQRLSAADASDGAVAAAVHSPMPGKIVRVLVGAGQAVGAGEPLIVLEAMKMEHTMKAPADAVVAGVHAVEGEVVGQKALLLSLEKPQEAAAAA